jgi:dCTP diphosphatase
MMDLLERLREFRDARDWEQFHAPKNLAISIAVEAAELLEIFQWSKEDASLPADKVSEAANEASDIFIYLLYFCDSMGIDLQVCTSAKIRANENRYPVARSKGVAGSNGRSGRKKGRETD